MPSTLDRLRETSQLTPAQFLAANPGCWIQYYDDTAAKDPAKALSSRSFDPATAQRKQREKCAICFSLQAFGESRTKEGLLCFRNLGVDVDLLFAAEKRAFSTGDIDRRKDEYLAGHLLQFPLKPHWLVETWHGFHVIFRIQPLREEAGIQKAAVTNRRLVRVFQGDEHAVLLTQVLRVPGTYQYKDPQQPFLCRLLLNQAAQIPPYDLAEIERVLSAWEQGHGSDAEAKANSGAPHPEAGKRTGWWREGLGGVPEGQRNAMAASIIGRILRCLPEELSDIAGWGGLKEWNQRNAVPLPERELRSVFLSIARRERRSRQGREPEDTEEVASGLEVCLELRVKGGSNVHFCKIEKLEIPSNTQPPSVSQQRSSLHPDASSNGR